QRIGDGDDLHHAVVAQPLDPATHRGLGQTDLGGDGAVGAASVALEQADDLAVDPVERVGCRQDLKVRALGAFRTWSGWFRCWHRSLPGEWRERHGLRIETV